MKAIFATWAALMCTPVAAVADERPDAGTNMVVARHYGAKDQHLGALNRLRLVLTQFEASEHVPEALALITESYLRLGIASEAQTAAAVLDRKFPGSPWSARAYAALASAALVPVENERSWISQIFR
jgi:outer membrane protein assembly factor BamD